MAVTADTYGLFFGAFFGFLGQMFTSVVTNPAALATVVILVLLGILTRLAPFKRRRRRR